MRNQCRSSLDRLCRRLDAVGRDHPLSQQLAEHGPAENEGGADQLERAELFAKEEGGEKQRREWLKVPQNRNALGAHSTYR